MTVEMVEEMLRTYRFQVGRCGHLQVEIDELSQAVARRRKALAAELAAPGAVALDGMPRGTAPGNPTERCALLLAEGWVPEDVREAEAKIAALKVEQARRLRCIEYVDGWLAGLNEVERWVVQTQVIDGVVWREVVDRFTRMNGEFRSKDTLKRLRDRALAKIHGMAGA